MICDSLSGQEGRHAQHNVLQSAAEKRERLLSAARAEFARVPYEDASVNRMIRAAGIPRGSFYMYFTDKEELFRFLMETYSGMLSDWMGAQLARNGGDLFAAFLALFDFIQAQPGERALSGAGGHPAPNRQMQPGLLLEGLRPGAVLERLRPQVGSLPAGSAGRDGSGGSLPPAGHLHPQRADSRMRRRPARRISGSTWSACSASCSGARRPSPPPAVSHSKGKKRRKPLWKQPKSSRRDPRRLRRRREKKIPQFQAPRKKRKWVKRLIISW